MAVYDKGDRVRLSAAFTNLSDVATDPTTVVVKIKDPSGNVATSTYGVDAAVVKDSTGNYHIDLDIDESGIWHHRWTGTGTIVAAGEADISVRKSNF